MAAAPVEFLNINAGILGHVDSGKTSLAKALSTEASTAAFDKSPQSQQRGITLDLGFSAFSMPSPFPGNIMSFVIFSNMDLRTEYSHLQFTLVDCPGHASLIRTIIGGAQIMDMMVLVIDVNKGIQTQTAEGLVIGSILTNKLVVALNKIDTLPAESRDSTIEKVCSLEFILVSLTTDESSTAKNFFHHTICWVSNYTCNCYSTSGTPAFL